MPGKQLTHRQREEYLSRVLLTIEEAADFLNVSRDTIRRLVAKGELAHVRVHVRRLRIARAELDAYITRNTHRGISPHPSDTHRRRTR